MSRSRQFNLVFEKGGRKADACFVIVAANNDLDYPRLGLAISRRQARRAVDRNRLKRIVRESFRRHAARLPPVDVVVMARTGVAERPNAALASSLEAHWRRLAERAETR